MNSVLRPAVVLLSSLGLGLTASAADWVESSVAVKAGYDSNVLAYTDLAPAPLHEDSYFATGSLTFVGDVKKAADLGAAWKSSKLSLLAEATRFENAAEENFESYRLGYATKWESGSDAVTADASVVRINGSRDTYSLAGPTNAFGLPVWRERRSQWQERVRAQWVHLGETRGWRVTGSTAIFDMKTIARSGYVPFVDRSDSSVWAESGFKQGPGWLWLGAQLGAQKQGTVPLPGCEFDYSNSYRRLSLGWAGKPFANLKVSFVGGPDWRRYTGNVNPAVFTHRNRQTWWFDSDATYDLSASWQLTAKVSRNRVVATTGKSAYDDFTAEGGVAWKASKTVQWRLSGRAQQAKYFPAARTDWIGGFSTGVDWAVSPRLKCGADVTWQYAWSQLQPVVGRDFERTIVALRGAWTF